MHGRSILILRVEKYFLKILDWSTLVPFSLFVPYLWQHLNNFILSIKLTWLRRQFNHVNFVLHTSHDMWLDEWIHVTPLLQSHIVAYMNYKVYMYMIEQASPNQATTRTLELYSPVKSKSLLPTYCVDNLFHPVTLKNKLQCLLSVSIDSGN